MNDLKDLLDARLFLLDMDGTLYLGDDVFPGAVDFIHTCLLYTSPSPRDRG